MKTYIIGSVLCLSAGWLVWYFVGLARLFDGTAQMRARMEARRRETDLKLLELALEARKIVRAKKAKKERRVSK